VLVLATVCRWFPMFWQTPIFWHFVLGICHLSAFHIIHHSVSLIARVESSSPALQGFGYPVALII
jgi:hypothetical protein